MHGLMQEQVQAKPIFSCQKAEARVIQLEAGRPATYKIPTPNPENENSALLISYQVTLHLWSACHVCLKEAHIHPELPQC